MRPRRSIRGPSRTCGARTMRRVTDPGFKIAVRFGRFMPNARGGVDFVPSKFPASVLQGVGNGTMLLRLLNTKSLADAEVREGDWLVVDDPDPDLDVVKGTR